MKLVRRLHMYAGVFFAPSIIFFALSGLIQLSEWHESEGGAEPAAWLVKLAEVHRIQSVDDLPKRGPRPAAAAARPASDNLGVDRAAAAKPPTPKRPEIHRSAPLKAFFALMSIALILSTLGGLAIAFQFRKQLALVGGLLAAGVGVPILLLFL